MRNIIFGLTVLLTISTSLAQKSYHEDAMKYFVLNGTERQYSEAVDQMFDLLQKQFENQEVPEKVWRELRANKTTSLTHIKSLLVSAYRGNFSHDDIKELIRFYESDTGKQMVQDVSQLDASQKVKLSEFFTSPTGQKVQNQSSTLKSMVSEVSELWSRDLYQETLEKLKVMGYQLPE